MFAAKKFILLLLLNLFLIGLLTTCAKQSEKAEIDCFIQTGYCLKTIDNLTVIFDSNPKPVRSMSELIFSVTLKEGYKPIQNALVEIDLTMPGMYMGENKVRLSHKGNGIYEGKGVIPRCPSGSKIWKAEAIIKRNGKTASISYVFEVN